MIGNRTDRFILLRLLLITTLVLVMLIFIYVIVDFSENSDDFTDRGAAMAEIWGNYYLQYIPEIIRLVTPAAVFTATLLVLGKMAQQLEVTALKAAGVSLYRLSVPFLLFALAAASTLAWMDAKVVPDANKVRIEFERTYLMSRSDRIDRSRIFRQESENTILAVNYYLPSDSIAYRTQLISFEHGRVKQVIESGRMEWREDIPGWAMFSSVVRTFDEYGYTEESIARKDTVLNIRPRDLSRTTSDVYLMRYAEVLDYLESLDRIGAGDLELPRVQFYGKLAYPLSVIVITILGVAIASVRRQGGTGLILGTGLGIMFAYLALMKLAEPFGVAGTIDPLTAVMLPHAIFAVIAVGALVAAKK